MKYANNIFKYNNIPIYIHLQVVYYYHMAMLDFSNIENLKKLTTLLHLISVSDIAREMGYKGKRPDNMLRTDLYKEGIKLKIKGWELEYNGNKKKRIYNNKKRSSHDNKLWINNNI
jgi:hypothetical protein